MLSTALKYTSVNKNIQLVNRAYIMAFGVAIISIVAFAFKFQSDELLLVVPTCSTVWAIQFVIFRLSKVDMLYHDKTIFNSAKTLEIPNLFAQLPVFFR